ncbi:related to toxD gene [Ramularia collo-cygni]|uniref:Related to toxD protein n=1 Tax=Ramularia collo-cygni TaxID=112498 RepID=A0A2D3VCN2_9PEZI|nr:related to toxD gene [Ramularia collo-cygni]CZT22762.1 related to toxD gene [Ramularia collo-cygni]
MPALPSTQTLVVQNKDAGQAGRLPLAVVSGRPLPQLRTDHDLLVRVLAVGLNPVDMKMVKNFFMEDTPTGCDFCGIVELAGPASRISAGSRVVAGELPYRPDNQHHGGFAQYAVADSRNAFVVPEDWSDTLAAGLGNLSWGTVGLAMSKIEALGLTGIPSAPSEKPLPVLVYGAGTATGVVAIQMLKQSGYTVIGVCSEKSAERAIACGAIGTADYTSPDCISRIQELAHGMPIKHALDCITQPDTVEICYSVLARLGARYVCLENCPESWRPRKSVKVNVVMGYEMLPYDIDLGNSLYTRKSNAQSVQITRVWVEEVQKLVDAGSIKPLPIEELEGGFHGIIEGLEMIQKEQAGGRKLVVRVSGGV